MLGPRIRPACTVVLESTTYPGTTDELVAPALEAASGLKAGVDFHVGYSPERIDPGNREWTLVTTPKVVAGLTPASLAAVDAFYVRLVDRTVPVGSTRVAELTKLLENTFRHVNIALVNELAVNARALGIDMWEAIDAAATKPFGFMPFRPGPGVGGHCLPIDPSYLSWRIERQLGVTSRFVETANDINRHMPGYVVRRVQLGLNRRHKPVNGARVLVLGIAYKKNTNDARETPADGVVSGLVELGAEVLVHDDHVGAHELDIMADRVPLTSRDRLPVRRSQCSSRTTTTSITTSSCATPSTCSMPATAWSADPSSACNAADPPEPARRRRAGARAPAARPRQWLGGASRPRSRRVRGRVRAVTGWPGAVAAQRAERQRCTSPSS